MLNTFNIFNTKVLIPVTVGKLNVKLHRSIINYASDFILVLINTIYFLVTKRRLDMTS